MSPTTDTIYISDDSALKISINSQIPTYTYVKNPPL